MAQTLPVYALVALLLVASAGPSMKAVRDASLGDFEALESWRSLDDFPFLKQVRPYLPPLVVDWVIVQRDAPTGLPPGVDFRFDDNGRVVLVWPDGCEETEERFREDSTCAPPPKDPCVDDPGAAGCDPCADAANHTDVCRPPECPAGHIVDPDWPDADPACVPDPRCEGDAENGTQPADCPPPVTPPPPRCGAGTVEAYDGTCILVKPTLLRRVPFPEGDTATRVQNVQLKVPYENLSLEVAWGGLTSPGYTIKLFYTPDETEICWVTDQGGAPGDPSGCHAGKASGIGSNGRSYRDTWDGAIPQGNLTLFIEPTPAPSGNSGTLEVRLYGTPHQSEDATDA